MDNIKVETSKINVTETDTLTDQKIVPFVSQDEVRDTDLVMIQNNTLLTTSRTVAEKFDKPHNDVMKSIRRLIDDMGGLGTFSQSFMFVETTYVNKQNKQQPQYLMTRDGFSLLAMGFTGKKALEFKLKFIDAFNRMEVELNKKQQHKPMTSLEILQHQVAVMTDHENRLNSLEGTVQQQSADIKRLQQNSNGLTLRHEMTDIKQQRQLDQHEKRLSRSEDDIKELKDIINDKGPAEEIKILISDIVTFTSTTDEPYSYKDAYKLFYDTLKSTAGIRIGIRIANLKKRKTAEGWSKTNVDRISGLDAITADPMIWPAVRNVTDILLGYLNEARE